MPSVALDKIQAGVYSALAADATFMALVSNRLYDYVPDNSSMPYAKIANGTEVQWDTFGNSNMDCLLDLFAYSSEQGFKEATDIIDRAATVLENGTITVSGYTHVWTRKEVVQRIESQDGRYRFCSIRFRIYVQE